MEAQKDTLSPDTLAAIQWLGMPEGTPFPLAESKAPSEPSPRPETMAQVELLPAEVKEWDDAMHAWTQARCSWRERSSGSLSRLYISHIEHTHQTGGMFAPDRETFVAILMALGFQIQDGMVSGLLLREDYEAAHWRPEPLNILPKRKRGAR